MSILKTWQEAKDGLVGISEPFQSNPMGFRSWTDLPLGSESPKKRKHADAYGENKVGQRFDMRGLPNIGFALPVPPSAGIVIQNSGDFSTQFGSSGTADSSCTSYDTNSTGNADSVEDASLSSYLMDEDVRALLRKVTVNEGALNQKIQSLGGGEKGLKELVGYIMLWVKEHKGENCENLYLSHNLKELRFSQQQQQQQQQQQVSSGFGYASSMAISGSSILNPTPGNEPYGQRNVTANRTFEKVQSSDDAFDPNQFHKRAKLRRSMDDGEVDSSTRPDIHAGCNTFVDVRGSVPDEFCFSKLETNRGSLNSISEVMISGMPRELGIQRPGSCVQSGLSFASRRDGSSRTVAATTRAARRNRIARQRQSVQQSHTHTPSNGTAASSACGLWSVAPPTLDSRIALMSHPGTRLPSSVPAGRGTRKVCNMDTLTFLLQKELRPSDVGNLGRIILPKKEAELHLPILALREGISLQMGDFDSGYCWNIRYRFWPNNKSRMYLLENTGEFVKSHNLEEGDFLVLYRNQQGNYILRGKKVLSESMGAQGLHQKNAHSLAADFPETPSKVEEVLKERDFEVRLEDRSSLTVKTEPNVLVGDDDLFFKEDVMHNISSSFGAGLLQPLERFPSLNLDFSLDEIMAGIPKDDHDAQIEPNLESRVEVVPKTEPAG